MDKKYTHSVSYVNSRSKSVIICKETKQKKNPFLKTEEEEENRKRIQIEFEHK